MVTGRVLYLAFLGLLALERLAELTLSRRNARRAFARGAVEVGQRHYRIMAAFHTLFLLACAAQALRSPSFRALTWAALAGALAAQALRYWAIATLGDRWNVRIIVTPGAAPVVAGPYRWVRHPNYVAVATEMLCVPLIYGGLLSLAIALTFSFGNALILLVRIRAEEAALGSRYAAAFAHTPRFLPGGKS
jgi:methyltransferase